MSDRLAELLKFASNDSGDTSDDKPPGVRVGDILSNGWASNRNPNKLFMYLGMSGDSFRGVNIQGKNAGPLRRENKVRIVLPRDTPDFWKTWELLAKQLPLLCLALLCLSGCLTAAALDDAWEFCPCRRHGLRSTCKTAPTPKIEPEDLRPNVPPRMMA